MEDERGAWLELAVLAHLVFDCQLAEDWNHGRQQRLADDRGWQASAAEEADARAAAREECGQARSGRTVTDHGDTADAAVDHSRAFSTMRKRRKTPLCDAAPDGEMAKLCDS